MRMKVLAISSRKQHLFELGDMLKAMNLRNPKDGKPITQGFYFGFTADCRDRLNKTTYNKKSHKEMLTQSAKCDIVLGIDALAKEGLDIPDRNALVWLTPPGIEIEQPVGRILRKFHAVNPIVVDFVDNTGNFVKHSGERDKWFEEEDYVLQHSDLELIGDHETWLNDLYVTINENNIAKIRAKYGKKKKKVSKKEKPKEPNVSVCLL